MKTAKTIRAKFEGTGVVRNPDGSEKQVRFSAEKMMTPEEARKHGYHSIKRG